MDLLSAALVRCALNTGDMFLYLEIYVMFRAKARTCAGANIRVEFKVILATLVWVKFKNSPIIYGNMLDKMNCEDYSRLHDQVRLRSRKNQE